MHCFRDYHAASKLHFCRITESSFYSLSCVSPALTAKSKDALHTSHEAAQELADSSGEPVCFRMGRSNVAVHESASILCGGVIVGTQMNAALAVISLSGDSRGSQEAFGTERVDARSGNQRQPFATHIIVSNHGR
jgi:hypothetical protein